MNAWWLPCIIRLPRFTSPEYEQNMRDILANIQAGSFAEEWSEEQATGYKHFEEMQGELRNSLFGQAEREVMKELAAQAK